MGNKLIECVPNYSEGRDLEKIEKIVECFRAKKGVRLLDYQTDPNHNRLVVTVIGEPEPSAMRGSFLWKGCGADRYDKA